jgi:hypothetical protein
MTLTEFILSRIAEDEAVARAVRPNEYLHDRERLNLTEEWHNGYTVVGASSGRVLAECVALREVVRITRGLGGYYNPDAAREAPGILRALATIWSDHEDYRPEEWA